MKMKLLLVTNVLLIFVFCLNGCTTNDKSSNGIITDEEKIVGTWINSSIYQEGPRIITYNFLSDNTCIFMASYNNEEISTNGTWKIINKKLECTIEGQMTSGDYSFSNDDKTLTLIDKNNVSMVFTKQLD